MELKEKNRLKIVSDLCQNGGYQKDKDEYKEQWRSTFITVEFLLIGFLVINVFLDVPILEKRGTSKVAATLIVVVMELLMRGFLIASAKEYLSRAQFVQRKAVRSLIEKGEIPDPDDYPLLRGVKLRGGEKNSFTFRIGTALLFVFAIIFVSSNRDSGAGIEAEIKVKAAQEEIKKRYEPQFLALKGESVSHNNEIMRNHNAKLMKAVQDSIRYSYSEWHKKDLSEVTAKLQVLRMTNSNSSSSSDISKKITQLTLKMDEEIKNVKIDSNSTTIFNIVSSLLPLVFIPLIVWTQTYIVMTDERRSVFIVMFERPTRVTNTTKQNIEINDEVVDDKLEPKQEMNLSAAQPNCISRVETEEKLTPKKLSEFLIENNLELPSFDSVKSAKARGDEDRIYQIVSQYKKVGVTITFNGNYPHFSKKKGLTAIVSEKQLKAKAK